MELLLEFIFAHIIKGSQVADTLYSNIIANDIDKGKSASCKSDFAHSTYFRWSVLFLGPRKVKAVHTIDNVDLGRLLRLCPNPIMIFLYAIWAGYSWLSCVQSRVQLSFGFL